MDNDQHKPDLIENLIDIVVAIGGIALMIYLQRNYASDLADWFSSFF